MALITIPEFIESVDPDYIQEVFDELEGHLNEGYREFFAMLIAGEIKFVLPARFYRIKAKNVDKRLMRAIGSIAGNSLVYCGPFRNFNPDTDKARRFMVSLPRVAYMIFTMEYPEGRIVLRDTSNIFDISLENLALINYTKTPSPPVEGDSNYVNLSKIRKRNSRFRSKPIAPTYLNVGQTSDAEFEYEERKEQ